MILPNRRAAQQSEAVRDRADRGAGLPQRIL